MGFFSASEVQSASRPNGKMYSCASCGLHRLASTPRMKPFGNFSKGILNIGEAPGETEDEKGKPWQGAAGRLLKQMYRKLGIDLFEDCLNINAVNCRPVNEKTGIGRVLSDKGETRPPTPEEINSCRSKVLKVITEQKPKVIVLFGAAAVASFLGHRWKKDIAGISKWRGWTIPDRDFNAWVCPVWHPSFVQETDGKEVETIWRQDLERALGMLEVPFPAWQDEHQLVEIIESPSQLDLFPELVAIDYETTGLKPHAPGHKIICASVAYNENKVQVFMMPEPKAAKRFVSLLADKQIGKMAHNMKFEDTWSAVYLNQPVQNWKWDSMQAAHILDNRPGVSGLKFQAYVNFGVIDYDSDIESYLKGVDSKNANSLNRIQELISTSNGAQKLMEYCGLDSLYEFRLAMKQQRSIYG